MRARPWLLAALGLVAYGLLVWFAGPLVSVGDRAPLAPRQARAALIAAFVLVYLAHKGWVAQRARRRNRRLLGELAPPAGGPEPADVVQLRNRFTAALTTLRHTRFGAHAGVWSSLSWKFGRQYLYQLPWYLIIGAPGAGKTTALLNSGLQFPLAGQFGRGSIKGVGGTRNCDWWFTDHAVLLDTAGRYTTHEANRAADRQAWEGFLALLTRARPRQALNGALVAVSVSDLLVFDSIQRAQHAATLRARLDEIRAAIGIQVPVYLLLTKCDLLPGFLDSFLALDKRARDQVWGTTFDLNASRQGRAADDFPAAFEQLAARLHDGLIERMQAERDPQRRARIFAFPRQFAGLREPLNELVRQVFDTGTAALVDDAPCLRGVYFTSGTQEGTPIDRALSALGRELGLERQILPPNQSTGRSFFVTSLLRDVVFVEAEVAGRSPGWQRWRGRAITGLLATVQCAGALLAAYWVTSYSRSSTEIEQIARDAAAVKERIEADNVRPGIDPRPLLPALNAMQDLNRSIWPDAGSGAAGPVPGFRRNQQLKLAAAAQRSYDRMLLDSLLPRIAGHAREQMSSGADLNLQYEALKAYAMMHDPAHFDAASMRAFVTYEWDSALEPPLASEEKAQLAQHLDALLDAGATGEAGSADPGLVESVRSRVATQPLAQRIATRLKSTLGARPYPDFTVASLGQAAALFVGRDGQSAPRTVPGRFTLDAYREAVQTALPRVVSDLASETRWVASFAEASEAKAGGAGEPVPASEASAKEALAAYLSDYARSWAEFIEDLRLKHAAGPADAMRQAQVLAARDGPLASVLQTVVLQTSLRHDASAAGTLGEAAVPLERAVAQQFQPLRELVTAGGDGRRPLDAVLADFSQLHVLHALVASDTRSDSSTTNAPGWLERVQADARRYPEPVRSLLLALSQSPVQQAGQRP